jgi:alkanesulfonate monooxygenase SsuD/methylene tetrahydromethanopterin reductase-like flavin-dependent oxidoreductase (luciferase family)
MSMANGARPWARHIPGRFVLGIGVSHAPSVRCAAASTAAPCAHEDYLEAMAVGPVRAPEPDPPVPLVLAALGPRMLELAAERADGAHPYFVPVEHTPFARRHLGPEACLAVEMTAVLTTDRAGP